MKNKSIIIIFFITVCLLCISFFLADNKFNSIWKGPQKINTEADANMREDGILVYKIYIDPKDYKEMQQKLPDKYIDDMTIMEKNDQIAVPAKFYNQGVEYDVEVRYRGDFGNHWRYNKKSLKIELIDGIFDNGTETKKLFIPQDRSYFIDMVDNYRAKKLGLLAPESQFVEVYINDENQGIYYEIEPWEKPFLETRGKSSDTSIFGEDFPQSDYQYFLGTNFWDSGIRSSDKFFGSDPYYSEMDFLVDMVKNSSKEYFDKNIFNIVDKESFLNWNVNAILSSSAHQARGWNERWYFDQTRGKFIAVPWDTHIYEYIIDETTKSQDPPYRIQRPIGLLGDRILSDNPDFLQDRNMALWKIVEDDVFLEDILDYYEELEYEFLDDIAMDSNGTESEKTTRDSIRNSKELYKKIYYNIREQLRNPHLTVGYNKDSNSINIKAFSLVNFTVKNSYAENYCYMGEKGFILFHKGSIDSEFYPEEFSREIKLNPYCKAENLKIVVENNLTKEETIVEVE